MFQSPHDQELHSFGPDILAGSLDDLRNVPAAPTSLKTVVIFSSSPLTEPDRDWLWNKFQVPCFEQLLGSHGRVIAEECEVHCGLHVLETVPASAMLTSVECACGRVEPRLLT